MKKTKKITSIWIEAEQWMPGTWVVDDADTDVIITWEDGTRSVATFLTYKHIQTLIAKYKKTGDNLSGAYIWMSDMILIDEISRSRIEEVIMHLILEDELDTLFSFLPKEEDEH